MHSWYKIIIGIALSTLGFENQGDFLTKREPFTKMLIWTVKKSLTRSQRDHLILKVRAVHAIIAPPVKGRGVYF